jgi:two-component sensor histidine kinase
MKNKRKMDKMIKYLGFCFFLLIVENMSPVFAQNRTNLLKGQVLENLTRGDGKNIDVAVSRALIIIPDYMTQPVRTNENGFFELKLDRTLHKGDSFTLKIEKNNYGVVSDKNSLKIINGINLTNSADLNLLSLKIYMTKLPRSSKDTDTEGARVALSGYITFRDEILEDVNIKIKGVDDVYDNTNEQGFFEIYLPSDNFRPQETFTLVLQKDGRLEEIKFKDLRDFQTHPFISFDTYLPSKQKENTANKNNPETDKNKPNNTKSSALIAQNQNLEKDFRRFIDNLDKIDLRGLTSNEIQILKDSLNIYADYISDISEQNQNLTQKSDQYVTLLEKTRAQQQKLMETEKELIRVELENQNKTNVIISLSAILMILSGWIYYYFYVNRKIKIQTEELNKRHRFIDFLLQELNHRVTNNLQVISSMLRRKIRRLSDENSKLALKEINKRVMDISAIHLGLYSQNDSRPINLKHYIRNITNTLEKLYTFEQSPVKITINAPNIEMAHKDAVFFGLIINELVTNAMKYAFQNEESPELWIEVIKKNNNQYMMQVRDNGKGVPDDFDLEKAKSSGLKLVNLITQMLDGTFKMKNEQGSKFDMTLRFS